MSFTPVEGQDIRIQYQPDTRTLAVEQVRVRRAGGAFHPEDLGSITDLNEERWNLRGRYRGIEEACYAALKIMLDENVQMRSVDFGPSSPQTATIQAVIDDLLTLRL